MSTTSLSVNATKTALKEILGAIPNTSNITINIHVHGNLNSEASQENIVKEQPKEIPKNVKKGFLLKRYINKKTMNEIDKQTLYYWQTKFNYPLPIESGSHYFKMSEIVKWEESNRIAGGVIQKYHIQNN